MIIKIPRNNPCPCGSEKKYKKCCIDKGFDWVVDEEGQICKSIPLSEELNDILKEQRDLFIETHGREPDPDEPVIFQSTSEPGNIADEIVETLRKLGVSEATIYAYRKTGRIVTDKNKNLLSDLELQEWDNAIKEYESTEE